MEDQKQQTEEEKFAVLDNPDKKFLFVLYVLKKKEQITAEQSNKVKGIELTLL